MLELRIEMGATMRAFMWACVGASKWTHKATGRIRGHTVSKRAAQDRALEAGPPVPQPHPCVAFLYVKVTCNGRKRTSFCFSPTKRPKTPTLSAACGVRGGVPYLGQKLLPHGCGVVAHPQRSIPFLLPLVGSHQVSRLNLMDFFVK
jgi:hypothetical protein